MASIMDRLNARSREVRNRRDQFFKSGGTGPFRYDEEMANVARDEENMRRESNALGNIMRQYQQAQIAPNGLRRPTGGIEEVPRAPVAPGTRPMIGQGLRQASGSLSNPPAGISQMPDRRMSEPGMGSAVRAALMGAPTGPLLANLSARKFSKDKAKGDLGLVTFGEDENPPEGAEWIGYRDGKKLYRLSPEAMTTQPETPPGEAEPSNPLGIEETRRSIAAGRDLLARKYAESGARLNARTGEIMTATADRTSKKMGEISRLQAANEGAIQRAIKDDAEIASSGDTAAFLSPSEWRKQRSAMDTLGLTRTDPIASTLGDFDRFGQRTYARPTTQAILDLGSSIRNRIKRMMQVKSSPYQPPSGYSR